MTKRNKSFFEIFLQGVGLYFSNANKFLSYMMFPVFGQLFGLLLIYYSTLFYNKNLSVILVNYPVLNQPIYKTIILMVILVPALVLYVSALWKYWIAYGAVNSMCDNLLKSGRVYDFGAHNQLVTSNWVIFLSISFIYHFLAFIAINPIFWIIGALLLIYFSLVFQVFIFEDLPTVDCFKKSSIYVQENFKKTTALILSVGALTYCIIPQIICTFLDVIKVKPFLSLFIAEGISTSSLYEINLMLSTVHQSPVTPESVSGFFVTSAIYVVTIQLLLPLRTICFCLWYKLYGKENDAVKKVDAKFMERVNKEVKRRKK